MIPALAWMEEREGRERVAALLRTLPSRTLNALAIDRPGYGVLASAWYASADAIAISDAVIGGRPPEQQDQMARQMAKAVMERTLRGVYGMLFDLMATPERYARYGHRLWAKYFDDGAVELTLPEPNRLIGRVSDWQGHADLLCKIVRYARVASLEAMGCKQVTSTHECKTDVGGNACTTVCRWG